jgi:hypothetical protein
VGATVFWRFSDFDGGQDGVQPVLKTIIRLPGFWLAMAVLVYGAFSRPAPAAMGIPELVIVGCLALAVGVSWRGGLPDKQSLLMAGVIWIAAMIGWGRAIVDASPMILILRDLLPFLFWVVPCLMRGNPDDLSPLRLGDFFGLAGLMMAARFWLAAPTFMPGRYNGWPDYLANDPVLWMAALWWVYRGITSRHWLWRWVILLGLPGFAAVVMTLQRAVLAMMLAGLIALWWPNRTKIWLLLIGALVCIGVFSVNGVQDGLALLWHKQQFVGWNSRDLEWQSLGQLLSRDGFTLWFGRGWGSSFASPAVGEWRVGYVHSLPGYLIFKLGVVGLIVWVAIIFYVVGILARKYQSILFVLLPAVTVPLTLSTAYKFPGFVLVLCFVVISYNKSSSAVRKSRSDPES